MQRLPVDILHHDERAIVRLSDFVDLADERVVECGSREGLGAETFASVCVRLDLGRQQLDGNAPPQLKILGTVHDTHAAGADECRQPITSAENRFWHLGFRMRRRVHRFR